MLKDKMSRDLEDWSEGTKKMGEQKRFGQDKTNMTNNRASQIKKSEKNFGFEDSSDDDCKQVPNKFNNMSDKKQKIDDDSENESGVDNDEFDDPTVYKG